MLASAPTGPRPGPPSPLHRLDGWTILRFAHAFEAGGGVEQHLFDLNRELGRRNRLTTLQIQLTLSPDHAKESEDRMGESRFIRVPLLVPEKWSDGSSATPHGQGIAGKAWQFLSDGVLRTSWLNTVAMRSVFRHRRIPRRRGEPTNAGAKAAELFRRFKVNLVVLHASGGADASEVIWAAQQARVPVVLVHHFSNDRLGGLSIRQQVCALELVGGASLVGVPAYLTSRFSNLSDAVDLQFYSRERANPLPNPGVPILYAPGRVTPDKGQMDVVQIAAQLKRAGLDFHLVFAGRVDSAEFEAQLRAAVAREQLTERVKFLGQLTLEQHRDWFAAAHLMLMPTRHHEGMPRTLIDSQAMEVPPLVYDIGGTREGLKHGDTGYLIRLGDVEGMADAAANLLRDAGRHRQMARAGRAFVEGQFSLAALAARHEEFYLAALALHRRKSSP
jgi:glycosyltransferase involved in cell wall biosynthesis